MPFDFSGSDVKQRGEITLIPNNTLARGILRITPDEHGCTEQINKSESEFGGVGRHVQYKVEIVDSEHKGRIIFGRINTYHSNTAHEKGREYVDMDRATVRAILEGGRNALVNNNYQFNDFAELDGLPVAIKIRIEAEREDKKTGKVYQARNSVQYFLSPNPASGTYKEWLAVHNPQSILSGVTSPNLAAPKAALQGGTDMPFFGSAGAPTVNVAKPQEVLQSSPQTAGSPPEVAFEKYAG